MSASQLKPYMGFSRSLGSGEAAILIFAYSAKEARKLGYGVACGMFVDEWIDWVVKKLKAEPNIMKQLRGKAEPCVVDDPETCPNCHLWGFEPVNGGECCVNCVGCEEEWT